MLYAGNPYVLPSTIVGAIVYLGLTILTDASLLVRVGVLVGIVGVVPIVVNRIRGLGGESTGGNGSEATADAETAEDAEATTDAKTVEDGEATTDGSD